jgi:dihydroflavonol-4-reductase
MFNVLVIGATGFIGGHIAQKAQQAGWQVHGLRRNPNNVGHLSEKSIQWLTGDLDDYPSLVKAMNGMDYVFHAGAWYPTNQDPSKAQKSIEDASEQMKRVIKATQVARIKRLIYTSSLSTIGLPPKKETRLADERDVYLPGTLPGNAYYEGKIIMENLALEATGVGYDIVILNPTLVLGPGDTKLSSSQILVMIANGQAKAVPAGMINIIDVREVAAAHINAARIGRSGQRYILGGDNYHIKDAVTTIADIAAVKPPRFTLPNSMIDLYIKAGDKFSFIPYAHYNIRAYRHWQGYNIDKAKRELSLGYRLLEETTRDSIGWFVNQGIL